MEAEKGVANHLQGSHAEADQSKSHNNKCLHNNINLPFLNMTNSHNTNNTLNNEITDTYIHTNIDSNHNTYDNIIDLDNNINNSNFSFLIRFTLVLIQIMAKCCFLKK